MQFSWKKSFLDTNSVDIDDNDEEKEAEELDEDEEDEEEEENSNDEDFKDDDEDLEEININEDQNTIEDFTDWPLYKLNNAFPIMFTPDMVTQEEVDRLAQQDIPPPTAFHPDFSDFSFSPREIADEDTPLAVMSMMKDLDMVRRWCINREALAKFVLLAKKGYNDNPYHNWQHAFSVTHFAYVALKNLDLISSGVLTYLEALTFFVSAICHDMDHRATNNSFQRKCNSFLATLYPTESSILERHHLTQATSLLETAGCRILSNLTKSEYNEFLEVMQTVIMATDLANHFQILNDLQDMAEAHSFDSRDSDYRHLILCLLITASDLSDQTKDWKSAITAASSVYEEFFSQGDLEKAMGFTPMNMMNRDIAVTTDLQISFLEKVAIPVYKILCTVLPDAIEPYNGITSNLQRWTFLQALYNSSREDPDKESAHPSDLPGIIRSLDFGES